MNTRSRMTGALATLLDTLLRRSLLIIIIMLLLLLSIIMLLLLSIIIIIPARLLEQNLLDLVMYDLRHQAAQRPELTLSTQ